MVKQSTSVNRPDAADVLELPPGVHKVEWVPDMRFPLCGTFTLYLEDYTVGYLLRNDLLRDKRVKFVGLRQPHPLTPSIELRIQAIDASPLQVFIEAVRRQRTCLSLLGALFKAAVDAHTSTVGAVESRPDALGTAGSGFDDGAGHTAPVTGLEGESSLNFV
ncbi:DNA-directed RNA polymerase II subunit rpb11 [Cyclospora cayetanensis]|uniref:DNA-directed RNA polymerase II subunit rpb11 n=2 Tax=Cyclospora cayetanensis TaxID=88456 RepID=A0A6P5WF11_9EIME|nr:DNA-directed RNA polymerase II subunit rpb11 [Cyclospora cayetanensis]OEH75568.1 RNA polymerase II subunit [Cyclospora cayetanensis]